MATAGCSTVADVLAVGTTEAELLAHLTNITEIAEMDPAAVHTLKQAVVDLRTQPVRGGERATATKTAEAECGSHTASEVPEDIPPEGGGTSQPAKAPRRPEGLSAHYLHEWVEDQTQGFEAARRRLEQWTPEQAFTDPETGLVAATPQFIAGSGWSVGVQLPSGRKSFIGLTHDGKELPGTNAYLPDYAPALKASPVGGQTGRELTEAERRTVFERWVPRYSQSTRMAWDEAVDPKMFEGSGWQLRAELVGCTTFIDVQKRRTPALAVHFGPADAMLSHSWENSLVSLDRAVQQHVEKKGLDPRTFRVWLDGFCIDKAAECTQDFLETTFREVIMGAGEMLSVLEPFEQPLPLFRSWCTYEMYVATGLAADKWSVIFSPEEEARMEEAVLMRSLGRMKSYVDQVDVTQATAFRESEERMIKAHIESLPGGAEEVNARVRGLLEKWQIPFIDDMYRKLHADAKPEPQPAGDEPEPELAEDEVQQQQRAAAVAQQKAAAAALQTRAADELVQVPIRELPPDTRVEVAALGRGNYDRLEVEKRRLRPNKHVHWVRFDSIGGESIALPAAAKAAADWTVIEDGRATLSLVSTGASFDITLTPGLTLLDFNEEASLRAEVPAQCLQLCFADTQELLPALEVVDQLVSAVGVHEGTQVIVSALERASQCTEEGMLGLPARVVAVATAAHSRAMAVAELRRRRLGLEATASEEDCAVCCLDIYIYISIAQYNII